MSDSPDDLESLFRILEPIMGERYYMYRFSLFEEMYLQVSYIFKNVIALRLDAPEVASTVDIAETEVGWLTLDVVRRISDEIERSTCTEVDVHTFAISLFKILADEKYSISFMLWVLLAAFAASKGIWLLALKFIFTDSRDESILMVLKKVKGFFIKSWERHPEEETIRINRDFNLYISLLFSSSVAKKPRDNWESMGSLYNLIKVMFDVGSLALLIHNNFYEFMPEPLRSEFYGLALVTVYWIIRGVFVCASQCDKLPQNDYVIQDGKKLREIHDKLISIHERLLKLEKSGKEARDDERVFKPYQIPDESVGSGFMGLFDLPDKSEDIKLLRCDIKDTTIPVAASRKGRILMLLISDLDISSNEINFLKEFYVESKTSTQLDFELIWLSILNGPWTTTLEGKYMKLLQMMLWYTIDHQRFVTKKTEMFIKDIWLFRKQPIIVVLNEDGRVVCPNAIHLLHIWRFKAFPFTRQRERELWSTEAKLNSLVFGFDSEISSMLEARKWVILYGGNDIEWIHKFTMCVRKVSSDLEIPIQMVYVGKNIEGNSLISEYVPQSYTSDMTKIWYFWIRLESLLISRCQIFSTTRDGTTDPIIQDVKKLLSYASAESWAYLSTPSSDLMIHGLGDAMLQGFMEYESWKQNIHSKEFPKYFKKHVEDLQRQALDGACSRIVLHIDNKDIIENLKCRGKKIMYRCCHGRTEFD